MKFGLAAVGKYNKRGDNWRSDTEDRALKHSVMSVRDGDYFASYEKTLPILSSELAALMGWESEKDYVYDYELTKTQISEIEKTCCLALPHNLTLFLTSSER